MLAVTPSPPTVASRVLHCAGCGRRLLEYAQLGTTATIRVRCRDCKATTELHGADIPRLLTTFVKEG